MHRVKVSVQKATLPVLMAALSNLIAGSVMLFAKTHAFYQVKIIFKLILKTFLGCSFFSGFNNNEFSFCNIFFLTLILHVYVYKKSALQLPIMQSFN